MLLAALSFGLLMLLPADFSFPTFAALLALNGIGTGMFAAPNTTAIMNSVPAEQRGAASGMRATFMNTGSVVSIGLFFSLMIVGLASTLPSTLATGLKANGVPAATAHHIASLPPVGTLFAAFLGYNPIQRLLGPQVLSHLSSAHAANLTGKSFFPHLISGPFMDGLTIVFTASMLMAVIAAGASLMRGANYVHADEPDRAGEPGGEGREVGPFGAPLDDGPGTPAEAPVLEEWTPA
jgi:hypothetical protein